MSSRFTVPELANKKRNAEKIVMVAAYDAPGTRAAEAGGADIILVGDSVGMVLLGHERTTSITMSEMLVFAGAVARTATSTLVIGDMPFMSYQESNRIAIRNAGRFISEAGTDAVKLEGGGVMVDRVRAIASTGISVVGHLGLTPQSAAALGGFRSQAKTAKAAMTLIDEGMRLQDAGACAIVLEAIPPEVASALTKKLEIPTIGIGSGPDVNGQVLVLNDLIGLSQGPYPRFLKRYADAHSLYEGAVHDFAADVRQGRFPMAEHTYKFASESERELFEGLLESVKTS